MDAARLVAVRLGAPAEAWGALGFTIEGDRLALANGLVRFDDAAHGIAALLVDAPTSRSTEVDGLPVFVAEDSCQMGHADEELDHIVVTTDSIERTSSALESSLGLECRRTRETEHGVRQAFHRFADPPDGDARGCILELVEDHRVARPAFWGLVVTVPDLERLCGEHPDLVSPAKPAVQSGRMISTARRAAGLGTAVAFMSR